MKKVLFFVERLFSHGYIGGAEKVLCTLVNHMDKKKYDVTVQTVFPDQATEMLAPEVHYKTMYSAENRFNILRYRLEAKLGLSYRLHMKDDYDIEAAYLEFGPTKVIAGSTNKKAKKLAWVHCDFETAIKDKESFRNKTKVFYEKIDRIICVSEKSGESFNDIFHMPDKTLVIHNVVDDSEILQKADMPIPDGVIKHRLTLLIVGRFFPQKNYLRLLRAISRLKADGFNFDLWIVGEGIERPKIETYIKDNSLQDTVTLWGFQKNPYPFMKAADLLVCSSDYEGYSTFVTEGLILGKPILTTDCSGMHELLGDSEYGIITENDDEAFYEGLCTVLENPEQNLTDMKRKAEKRSADFKLQKLVGDTEDFFESL